MSETEHRFADVESLDELEIDADDIEAAREKALDWLDNMDGNERYRAGWVDGIVLFDRILTDPEYFDIEGDNDE